MTVGETTLNILSATLGKIAEYIDLMDLTLKDRMILVNQFRILTKIDPENITEYERGIEILRRGYTYFYDDIAGHFDTRSISEAESKEVLDILDMFTRLEYAWERHGGVEGVGEREVHFGGWDGNNESDQLWFANSTARIQGALKELESERGEIPTFQHCNAIARCLRHTRI